MKYNFIFIPLHKSGHYLPSMARPGVLGRDDYRQAWPTTITFCRRVM